MFFLEIRIFVELHIKNNPVTTYCPGPKIVLYGCSIGIIINVQKD